MAVALLGYLRSFLVPSLTPVCCVSNDVAADVVGSSMALAAARSTSLPMSIQQKELSTQSSHNAAVLASEVV